VAELGQVMFRAPTTEQWLWETLIGGVVTWQRQREDISSQVQQVFLFRLDGETQMVRMEMDFLRDQAKVADWARWQDTLRHDLSQTERKQLKERTRHLMPTPLLCYVLDLVRIPDDRRRPWLKGYKRNMADCSLLLQLLTVGQGLGLDVAEHDTIAERDKKSESLQHRLRETTKELAEWDAEVVAREKDAERERAALRARESQRWDESVERTRQKTPAKAAPSPFFRNQSPSGPDEGSPYRRESTRVGLRSSTRTGVVSYPVEDAEQEAEDTVYLMLLNEMGGADAMHEGSVFDFSASDRVGYPHGIALGHLDIRILARAFRHLGVGEEWPPLAYRDLTRQAASTWALIRDTGTYLNRETRANVSIPKHAWVGFLEGIRIPQPAATSQFLASERGCSVMETQLLDKDGEHILLDFHTNRSYRGGDTAPSSWSCMNDFSGQARSANMAVVDGIMLVTSLRCIGENKVLVLDYGALYRERDPAFERHSSDRQPAPPRPIKNTGRPVRGVLDLGMYKSQVDPLADYFGTFQEVVPGGSGLTGEATVQVLIKWMLSSRTQIARTNLNKDTGFWEAYLPTLAATKGVDMGAKSFTQPSP
jgi:hypothetical protein